MKFWIQYGEYFCEVYAAKPTAEHLMQATDTYAKYCQRLIDTGGGCENPRDISPFQWFNLREVECK